MQLREHVPLVVDEKQNNEKLKKVVEEKLLLSESLYYLVKYENSVFLL